MRSTIPGSFEADPRPDRVTGAVEPPEASLSRRRRKAREDQDLHHCRHLNLEPHLPPGLPRRLGTGRRAFQKETVLAESTYPPGGPELPQGARLDRGLQEARLGRGSELPQGALRGSGLRQEIVPEIQLPHG